MRPFTHIAAALLLSLCAVVTLPAQVATVPVGFNNANVTAAVNATTPSSSVVSAPFYQIAKYQGALTSLDSSNQVSFSGGGLTALLTTPPYLARFKSGTSTGRFFIVTSNTDTQLTLDTTTAGYTLTTSAPTNTQAQIAVGDSVEILPANTLGTLFGTNSVPFQTGATANAADNVLLFNGTSWDVYYNNATNWKKSGSLANQNNTIVLPDRGMFIVRRATSALTLTFLGTVPSTTEKTDFPGPGSSFRANRFPVDATLKGASNPLNLQSLPGWQSGASASAADNVYLWNGTSWSVYYYNGTNWKKSGSLAIQDSTVIPLGTAMFIVRQSSAAGNNSTLTQALPYSL
jgi:uncharacterized protein (TIGR02597 family)